MSVPIDRLPSLFKDLFSVNRLAGAIGLTRTAVKCKEAAKQSLRETFTLRNKYSESSVRIQIATAETMQAEVYVLDKYLAEQEEGATRPVKAGGTPIPSEIRAAANIDEKKVIPQAYRAKQLSQGSKAISKNKPFIATANNTTGVWVRTTEARLPVRLLYVLFSTPKKIQPKPWFREPVDKAYDDNIDPEYTKALDEQTTKLLMKYGA